MTILRARYSRTKKSSLAQNTESSTGISLYDFSQNYSHILYNFIPGSRNNEKLTFDRLIAPSEYCCEAVEWILDFNKKYKINLDTRWRCLSCLKQFFDCKYLGLHLVGPGIPELDWKVEKYDDQKWLC